MKKVVKNLTKVLKALEEFGEDGQKVIQDVTKATAREIEFNAISRAPIDTGKLRQSIKAIQIDKRNWIVQANSTGQAPYAAYIEFGTGGLVNVPSELRDIAIGFRGRGIRKVNLQARPYLYPAFVQGRKSYIKDLETELGDLIKKTKA